MGIQLLKELFVFEATHIQYTRYLSGVFILLLINTPCCYLLCNQTARILIKTHFCKVEDCLISKSIHIPELHSTPVRGHE